MTTTTTTAAAAVAAAEWHWRETLDPEQAHRKQLLKIDKQIPFAKWLKNKRKEERKRRVAVVAKAAAQREEAQRERLAKEKERKEIKHRQREDAKAWREAQRARAQVDAQRKEAAKEKLQRIKARSERVKRAYNNIMRSELPAEPRRPTFIEWSIRKKREERDETKAKAAIKSTSGFVPLLPHTADYRKTTQDSRSSAYEAWLERKQEEDRLKAKKAREARAQRLLDEKILHAQTWQKKTVVCAYSQNRRSEKQPRHWRAVTLSLLS